MPTLLFSSAKVAEEGVFDGGFGIYRNVIGSHLAAGGVDAFGESANALEVGGADRLGIDSEHR